MFYDFRSNCKVKFITQINDSFESGGMSTSFNDVQFCSFNFFHATNLIPHIRMPLSSSVLRAVVSLLHITLKHNFVSKISILAGVVMSLHFLTVTKVSKGCPIVAVGPAETGKSTCLSSAGRVTGKFAACHVVLGLYPK